MQSIKLFLKQQPSIRFPEIQVSQMSRKQAQSFLVKLYQQMIIQEATFK